MLTWTIEVRPRLMAGEFPRWIVTDANGKQAGPFSNPDAALLHLRDAIFSQALILTEED